MSKAPPAMTDLARRLLALETSSAGPYGVEAAVRVADALRPALAKLTGVGGYTSLVSRALVVAKTDSAELKHWRFHADGTLIKNDGAETKTEDAAGVTFLAHLLAILVRFVGQPVTERLIQKTWPGQTLSSGPSESKETK